MNTDESASPDYCRLGAITLLMPADVRKRYWALAQKHIDGSRITAAEEAWSLAIMDYYKTIFSEDEIERAHIGCIKHLMGACEAVLFRRLIPSERRGWANPDKRQMLMRQYYNSLPHAKIIEEVAKQMALEKASLPSNEYFPH